MSRRRTPIYVESRIRAPMDRLWDATQDPEQHERWDVRFGRITYLPRRDGDAQRFTYSTTVAPGFTISGSGESLGERDRADGSRWSGLRFWARDRRSLIDAGAGYWRYVPTVDGVRFLTRFDYRPRWGRLGEALDRRVFRPLFGWATAWSFDRLRLWLEKGIAPERSRNQAIAHGLAVGGLAGTWLYQGLVPKLWCADDAEVRLWQRAVLKSRPARRAVRGVGAVEVLMGVATIVHRRKRWPFIATAALMPVLVAGVARLDRKALSRAFNPVSLNMTMAALAGIALPTADDLPSGRRPLRAAPDPQPDVGELP